MSFQQERDRVAKENKKFISWLHPSVRDRFTAFEQEARQNDLDLDIFSSLRTVAHQKKLYDNYKAGKSKIPAAKPGYSLHNYGFAIDTYVLKIQTKTWAKYKDLYKKLVPIAAKHGLYWLGNDMSQEIHHFEFNNGVIPAGPFVRKLKALKDSGKVDSAGYVLLDQLNDVNLESSTTLVDDWSTNILQQSIGTSEQNVEPIKKKQPTVITNVEEVNAVGIWQIIKMVADQYSLSQNINDATIAFDQGSLLNYIQKVVQEPWLEFFGDTVGDQYYFQVRKQPFDYIGWNTGMLYNNDIEIEDVLGDELSWYDGPIYSWFQIIPKGSFLGEQDLIFQHVSSVFFEEYAEVWGSKPLSVVSNYLNFIKISDGKIMLEKAFEDLRYLVESNVYLPFTRQGTITIKGDYKYRRGQKVRYYPTGEEFYVDSVSHSYNISEAGPVFTTTLRVSRGMIMKYLAAPMDATSNSYWNLILYSDPPNKTIDAKEPVKKQSVQLYFDNNRSYLINPNEVFAGKKDTISKKMQVQIEAFPELRGQLYESNRMNIDKAASLINENKYAPFECVGYVDSDKGGKTPVLAKQRAETIKRAVIKRYLEIYGDLSESYLNQRITTRGSKLTKYDPDGLMDADGKVPTRQEIKEDDNRRNLKIKALERFAEFVVKEHDKTVKKSVPQEGIGWKVNDPVFQFFLKRKQQNECQK
jgi:hypothetical protein